MPYYCARQEGDGAQYKTRFVTDRDGIRESDMMFELKIKDETVYFYVLLEFQSTVDKFMPVRMLTYIMLFYQDWLKKQIEYKRRLKQKEKKGTLDEADIEAIYETIKLPAVFPILLYNGDRKWTTPSELKELIGVRYEALGKYVPNFRYYKIIENEFSPGSKKEIKSINAAMFRLEQSGAKDVSKYALRLTKILMKEANPELQKDFKLWLNQLIRGYGIKASTANKIIKNLEVGDVTLLEATIKKNLETAKTEGEEKKTIEMAKKMLDEGIDISAIARVTGLSEAKIKTLAKKPTKKAA
ncbi:MAG TPA: Rpn family recombination-promoting nuclease/putative transposase [Candidatus Wallbacteria bacterium]|nr:Rpn family recombination-promoting nuclease/putative transposase [Candidatus Wallbacteria bacterium]